jgi:hypothetical protein
LIDADYQLFKVLCSIHEVAVLFDLAGGGYSFTPGLSGAHSLKLNACAYEKNLSSDFCTCPDITAADNITGAGPDLFRCRN